jgi:hypothetical protein
MFRSPILQRGLIPALGILLCASCSHTLAPEGHFQQTPITVDGNTNDWTLPLRFSNESYTLQYSVTNDDTNLYVCVLTSSETTLLRVLRAGMTLYFDPKGEKNKDFSIAFPIRKQPDPSSYGNRNGNPITYTDSKERKENLLQQSDYYNTTGFLNIENGQFAVSDIKNGIRLAMKLNNDDSVLVYEVAVPLKNILPAGLTPKAAAKNFSVAIVLNAPASQGGGAGNRPSYGGMRGGGMGGMRGGGMMGGGGGRGGYGSSNRGATAKEEANWYTFRLVAPKK